MIVKIDNETYIWHTEDKPTFCEQNKLIKNGSILGKAKDVIKLQHPCGIHLCKTNLHKYIDERSMREQIKKRAHYEFPKDVLICTRFIGDALADLNLFNMTPFILLPGNLINPQNYKIDFKVIEKVKIKNGF